MAEFTVSEVCAATGGTIVTMLTTRFTGVSTDTRTIKPGNLFVALSGERFDGHDFIKQAVESGAAGVLINRNSFQVEDNITVIKVPDTLKAYQRLAAFHRNRFDIPVIAITGSNGKTTTKDLTAAVLSSRFHVLKTQANYNNEIGLPLTLLNLNDSYEVAVVEMGMRGIGEIRELAEIASPTVGVVTNVGETHIELLGSLDNIALAKAELVEAVAEQGLVVLNADNHYVRQMQDNAKARVIFYGVQQASDVRAENIHTNGQQTVFTCICRQGTFQAVIPAVGRHNVYNALAAISIGLELGLTFEEIKTGLNLFTASAMRLAIEKIGEYHIINDAYNASPLSMVAAIDTLVEVAKGRSVAVLGDMLELGHIAVEAHQRIGSKLAACGVDIVITVGELARYIAYTAQEQGVTQAAACDNHSQARELLQKIIKPGDTILVKGSRGMQMEKILEMLM